MAIIRGQSNNNFDSYQKAVIHAMDGLTSSASEISRSVGNIGRSDFATAKNQASANVTLSGILSGVNSGFKSASDLSLRKIQLHQQTNTAVNSISSGLASISNQLKSHTSMVEKTGVSVINLQTRQLSELQLQTQHLSSISQGIAGLQRIMSQNSMRAPASPSASNSTAPAPVPSGTVDLSPVLQLQHLQLDEAVHHRQVSEGIHMELQSIHALMSTGISSAVQSLNSLRSPVNTPVPNNIRNTSAPGSIDTDIQAILNQMRGENHDLNTYTQDILSQMRGINEDLSNVSQDILEEMSRSQEEASEQTTQILDQMRRQGAGSDGGLLQKWDDFINNTFGKEFLGGLATFSGAATLIANSINNSNEVAKKINLNLGENISQQGRMTYSHAYTEAADRNYVGGIFGQRISKDQYNQAMSNALTSGVVDQDILVSATSELALFNTLMPEVNASFDGFIRENSTIFEDGEDRIRATTMLIKEYSENYQVTASSLYRTVGKFEGTIKQFSGSTEEYAENMRNLIEQQSKLEEVGLEDLGIDDFITRYYNEGFEGNAEATQYLHQVARLNEMTFTELNNILLQNKNDPGRMHELLINAELKTKQEADAMFDDTTMGGMAAKRQYIKNRTLSKNYLDLENIQSNLEAYMDLNGKGDRVTAFDNGNIIDTSKDMAIDTLRESVYMTSEEQMKAQADYNAEAMDQTVHIADTAYRIGMDTTKILGTLQMIWGAMTMFGMNGNGGILGRLFGTGNTVNPLQNHGGIRGIFGNIHQNLVDLLGLGPRPVVDGTGNPVTGAGGPLSGNASQGNAGSPNPSPVPNTGGLNGSAPVAGSNAQGTVSPVPNGSNPVPNSNPAQGLTVSQSLRNAGNNLRSFASNVIQTTGRIGRSVLSGLQTVWAGIRKGWVSIGNTKAGAVFSKLGSNILKGIKGLGSLIAKGYTNMLGSHAPAVTSAFKSFGGFLGKHLTSLWGVLKTGTSNLLSLLKSNFPQITSALSGGITWLIDGLKGLGGKITKAGQSILSKASSSVMESVGESVADSAADAIGDKAGDVIEEGIDTLTDTLSKKGKKGKRGKVGKKGKGGLISSIVGFAAGLFLGEEGEEQAEDAADAIGNATDIINDAGIKIPKKAPVPNVGGALLGAAPGAIMATGGVVGAVKGAENMEKSTHGAQGTASAVQGLGGAAAVTGGALATAGGVIGAAGGISAGLAGATGVGALAAGLSAIPVIGWIGAGVMAAGLAVSEAADHYKKLNKGISEVSEAFDMQRDALKADSEARKENAKQMQSAYSSLADASQKAEFLTNELGLSSEEMKNISEAQMDVYARQAVQNEQNASEDGGFWYKLTHWGKGKSEVANEEMGKAAAEEMSEAQNTAVSDIANMLTSSSQADREAIVKDLGLDQKLNDSSNFIQKQNLEDIKNILLKSNSSEEIEKAMNRGIGLFNEEGTIKDTLTIGKIENLADKYSLNADVSTASALTENGIAVSQAIQTLEAYAESADTNTLKGEQREEYVNALNTLYDEKNKAAAEAINSSFDLMKYRDIRTDEEKGISKGIEQGASPVGLEAVVTEDDIAIANMLSPLKTTYNYINNGTGGMDETSGGFAALGATSNMNEVSARAQRMGISADEYMNMQSAVPFGEAAPGLETTHAGTDGFTGYISSRRPGQEGQSTSFSNDFEATAVENPMEGSSIVEVVQSFEVTVAEKLDRLIEAISGGKGPKESSKDSSPERKFGAPDNPTEIKSPLYQPKLERPLDQQNILNYAR